MRLIKCMLTANDCYKAGRTITPKGVMVHSTGANNPLVARYVQPVEGQSNEAQLKAEIGGNRNANDWNNPGLDVCTHAFVGKLADGGVGTVQTLPWNHRGWHAGTGTSGGSANDTHIAFEICEDDLTDEGYFRKVYQEAVELTAMLCKTYNLNPLADGVVICHSEGYKRGIASNHGDVMHWFPKFNKSMDTFRADVAAAMGCSGGSTKPGEPGNSHGTVPYTVSVKVTELRIRSGPGTDAAIKGIQAMNRPTWLIGGGYDKESCYDQWIESFHGKVRCLVLIGQTREKIKEAAEKQGFHDIVLLDSLQEAVAYCGEHAVSGEAVLLSPACASWGQFDNYEQRGDMFKEYVRNL